MYVTKHIDWLAVTVSSRADVNDILPASKFVYIGGGHHGYKSAFEDQQTGARVETDSPVEGMDTHLTMSGQTLDKVRELSGQDDDDLLARVRSARGRASRVDACINIHEGQLTVRDFYDAYRAGDLKTMTRRAYYVEGIGDDRAGDTMYFGSPKSDRQCRVYNKAAEQAIVDGEAWLRLELALRNLRAKSLLAATQDNRVAATISAMVADTMAWGHAEFGTALVDETVDIHPIKRKRPATEKWLLEQCAPALARVYAVKPEFMVEFMTSFRQSLDKLSTGD